MENLQKNTKDGLVQIVKRERKWHKDKMKIQRLRHEDQMEIQRLRYGRRIDKLKEKEKHRKELETKDAEINRLTEKNGEDRGMVCSTTNERRELNQVPDMLCSTTNERIEVCGGGTKRKENPVYYRIPKKRITKGHPDKVLSERERKILEGITKFALKKSCVTNFFQTYEDWFNWIKEKTQATETIIFQNYIFIKCLSAKIIHFTDGKKILRISDDELVLPVIKEGWKMERTRCYMASSSFCFKNFKAPFVPEENLERGYFKMKCQKAGQRLPSHSLLVFVREE